MFALLKKEINSFFASPIGYLVVALFLLCNGLFLWLFKNDYNILDNGFADLTGFFNLAPWVFVFLIPAVTMRSFSDEKKQGTLELLLTKPISHLNIVLGKYFGAVALILIALIPTLLYVYTVYQLGNPIGNLDMASVVGSYLGLLFLILAYTAIGIFASTLSDNQIVAFIIAVALCLLFYFGFNSLAEVFKSVFFESLGMEAHYKSMSRGVLDTRDIIYFLSVTVLFIALTVIRIGKEASKPINWVKFAIIPVVLIGLNVLSSSVFKRFDLTSDNRYTLSDASKQITDTADSPLIVDVFLEGEFPSEFKRLQTETRQLLEEFSAYNNNIKFSFLNPLADDANRQQVIQQLSQRGMQPMRLTVKESGKSTEAVIFPWALASFNGQTVTIPLVKNKIGANQQDLVTNSVQHLEYAFSDGFSKLINPKQKKIAVLQGNGQFETKYIADFLKTIRDYYFIAPFTLDSVANNPNGTLDKLKEYDLILSAGATEPFTENEKLVLDQFVMQGGKSLWLNDMVAVNKDSLIINDGKAIATARDLNLTDMFFKYGVRVNPVLNSTLYSAPITLAIGEGSQAQFQPVRWPYSPLASTNSKHPIVNNLNLVKFDFANQIDTLKNSVSKTILLESAPLTKLEGMPRTINLEMVTQEQDPKRFNKGNQVLAVLLEGEFTSAYNNRIKPFKLTKDTNKSTPTKMIVVADADVLKNEVGRNGPQELGFDRWTGQVYGNKEFLLNAVNYLLDDNGLINLRSKDVAVAFLDTKKIETQKTKWQLINIALPLVLLALFGLVFTYIRKKTYAR